MFIYEGITNKSTAYTVTKNNSSGLTSTLSGRTLSITGLTPDSGSVILTAESGGVSLQKTYSIGKSKAGAQGANNQDFSFLDASLSGVTGALGAGLLMNSDVFGYHGAIGSGTAATLSDFTSFLDKDGNFYLGGNSSGATNPSDGYLAWNNTNKSLLISGSNANVQVDKFFLGNTNTQFISGSNGNITISGDVNFEGKNQNGATVFYDNFAQYANQAAVLNQSSPEVDGSGVGYRYTGGGEVTPVTGVGEFSGKALRLGNNSSADYVYISSNKLTPFNEQSLYEMEVRYKIEVGSGTVYAGIVAYKPDGTTMVNGTGVLNTLSSQHYFTVSGRSSSNDGNGWVIKRGFFKGAAASGNGGPHNSDTDPGTIHSDVLNGYISPMFAGNYNSPLSGQVLLDYIKITEIGGGGSTKISGDAITTGVIKSNNLATNEGSEFRLDDGTFKLGGTDAAHTKLEWDGTDLSVKGNITVTNAGDFADPNATATLNYSFTGNGSQTLDTGIWTLRNISGQSPTTSGIRITRGASPSTNWDGGIRTINEYPRSESPTLTFDWTQQTPSGVTTSNSGITMIGWWNGDTSNFSGRMYYGIYINQGTITARTTPSATGTAATLITNNAAGDKWRCKIRLKAGGGAMLELYRNGDFTTPAATHDYGTSGTLANLGFGLAQYKQGNSDLLLEQVAIGSQPATTTISGNGISTGILESTNLTGTAGSQFNLNDGKFKLGGTTSPKLEWDGSTLSVKGQITVEGGYNSSAGELFGNPTGKLLKSDGRPGGWSAAYGNNDASTIKSTDLGDDDSAGNPIGAIVELSSTTDPDIGMASHAFPIEVQQNYKINLVLKADLADSNGLYIRIAEYDSELSAGHDSISNNSNGSTTSVSNVQEDTREQYHGWTNDSGTAVTTENGPITTSYVSYNKTYTPTATAKYFSVVILNWSGMSPTETKLLVKSMNVRKVSQGTTITGDGISTGKIESANLDANVGSELDLDAGTIKLGGTSAPKFAVNAAGAMTASAGLIGGIEIQDSYVESTNDLSIGGPAYKLTDDGIISGSNIYIRSVVDIGNGDEVYPILDTEVGLIDARNNGRQVVGDNNQYYRLNGNDAGATHLVASYVFHLMPYETTLSVSGIHTAYSDSNQNYARLSGQMDVRLLRMSVSGSATIYSTTLANSPGQVVGTTGWQQVSADITANAFTTGYTTTTYQARTKVLHGSDSIAYSVPASAQAQLCKIELKLGTYYAYGASSTSYWNASSGCMVQGFSVIATRELAAATIGSNSSLLAPTERTFGA